ncbi:hypothetical protein, partial [Burkholderia sp. E168m23]|uniref:hypothetical protein n=1 Tax=Burkholderia sp. E168m23 TaxID=1561200 RepID=UPI001F20B217
SLQSKQLLDVCILACFMTISVNENPYMIESIIFLFAEQSGMRGRLSFADVCRGRGNRVGAIAEQSEIRMKQ